jgi:hypothetical protein
LELLLVAQKSQQNFAIFCFTGFSLPSRLSLKHEKIDAIIISSLQDLNKFIGNLHCYNNIIPLGLK